VASSIAKALAEFQRADVAVIIRALNIVATLPPADDLDKQRIRVVKSTVIQLELFGKIVGDTNDR
jgi:hypothetical protein